MFAPSYDYRPQVKNSWTLSNKTQASACLVILLEELEFRHIPNPVKQKGVQKQMSYIRKIWFSKDGRYLFEDKYHSRRTMPQKNKNKEKRLPKTKMTPLCQERINLRLRVDELTKLIVNNFSENDWWITFTLAQNVSLEEFKKAYAKMIRVLRTYYQKHDKELMYIAVHENLEGPGRLHGHMLIPGWIGFAELDVLLTKAWPLGGHHIVSYRGSVVDARRIAAYMVKENVLSSKFDEKARLLEEARKTGRLDNDALLRLDKEISAKRSYICTSKNLLRTPPKKEIITRADTFSDKIRPPKGYREIKQLCHNGRNSSGYRWQRSVFEVCCEQAVEQIATDTLFPCPKNVHRNNFRFIK